MQAVQAFEPPLSLYEQLEQEGHEVHRLASDFPAVNRFSSFEKEVGTRRMIFERSRKSILRIMSSVVVFSSPASISIVLERPSDGCHHLYRQSTRFYLL